MRTPVIFILFSAIAAFALGGPKEDAIKASQEWKFALARAVNQLVEEGQKDPKAIAKLATERTKNEEKKVRETGKAMGVSQTELDRSIKEDREASLKTYIEEFLRKE